MIPVNDLSRSPTMEEAEAIARVTKSGWYLNGPETERLERDFADYVGVDEAVGVASGTDALTLALAALGVGPGSRIATVANAGCYATVACRRLGATPVYIDVDPSSACMSPASLCELGVNLDAVIVTHLYGRLADMERLTTIAQSSGVPLVEDCAHAPGARSELGAAGSFGDMAAFSFYPTKNLGAMGDAGMIVGRDQQLITRARRLAQYGWESRFVVGVDGGFNSRMDEMQAAVLNVRLHRLDSENARRRLIASRFNRALKARGEYERLLFIDDLQHVAHLAVMVSDRRETVASHFRTREVETAVHYPVPDYRQPAWAASLAEPLQNTEQLSAQVLTIPCFPTMTESEIAAVEAALGSIPG